MLLNIKNCTTLFIVLTFITSSANAQNNDVKLEGIVKCDSSYLQDVNIINKTSNLGTFSKKNGKFYITVSLGDSILFSSIVYNNRIIKISETHINSKKIIVYLEPNYNQLDEIMLEKKIAIDWGNVAVTKGTILDNDEISNKKAPNARKLTDPNSNAGGFNPIAIFMMLTKKSRLKRKERKLEQEKNKQIKNKFITTIRSLYGDDFFVEWLYVPADEINLFIDFCEEKGLSEFYNSNEIVIKNFLIIQAKEFNTLKN
jgi:hypothetical protein